MLLGGGFIISADTIRVSSLLAFLYLIDVGVRLTDQQRVNSTNQNLIGATQPTHVDGIQGLVN